MKGKTDKIARALRRPPVHGESVPVMKRRHDIEVIRRAALERDPVARRMVDAMRFAKLRTLSLKGGGAGWSTRTWRCRFCHERRC